MDQAQGPRGLVVALARNHVARRREHRLLHAVVEIAQSIAVERAIFAGGGKAVHLDTIGLTQHLLAPPLLPVVPDHRPQAAQIAAPFVDHRDPHPGIERVFDAVNHREPQRLGRIAQSQLLGHIGRGKDQPRPLFQRGFGRRPFGQDLDAKAQLVDRIDRAEGQIRGLARADDRGNRAVPMARVHIHTGDEFVVDAQVPLVHHHDRSGGKEGQMGSIVSHLVMTSGNV
ncbi:hypothetical protein [Paracoccus cavernae]|uniref:hypothetical protein n=1 Tax=Paracoccus cavernae TaxID=1571207 RepID=UPI003638FE24